MRGTTTATEGARVPGKGWTLDLSLLPATPSLYVRSTLCPTSRQAFVPPTGWAAVPENHISRTGDLHLECPEEAGWAPQTGARLGQSSRGLWGLSCPVGGMDGRGKRG
ncbi:hypothetical protein VFPFJ_01176 [Purpureocillium lilacinum]|uniref:Uncharacterized protein n=1 Tax=Purpureocillium lilacinum TaxID=33203 RepID=A0A179HB13_PURLI|nr:hypothetical protein VFPFJ_01176 [Purpureocillium lilacinum]OAQ87112.1 hypothetical protein VFPBJ_01152 [Purpureocillium lilacinum]OAQ95067.1 hypothetical protein VFPFJ_01176 [Purpureocillium lilacinum]